MIVLSLITNGGYQFCHIIIEFILKTYGKETFIKWLLYPSEFLSQIDNVSKLFNTYIIKEIEARIN